MNGYFYNEIEAAFERLHLGVPDIFLREFQRLVELRNDNLTDWQAAWEGGKRPTGYCKLALYTHLILQALVDLPKATLTPRKQESVLGLALLAQFSAANDDLAFLEAADDETDGLSDIPDNEIDLMARLKELANSQESLIPTWDLPNAQTHAKKAPIKSAHQPHAAKNGKC